MFRIGEFSRLVRVSPRMLRHYEKCGLFCPAETDRYTGYRLYSAAQIPHLIRIVAFRDMGFSIDEMGAILEKYEDKAWIDGILLRKSEEMQSVVEEYRKKVQMLHEMRTQLHEELKAMDYEVIVKTLPQVRVLALRDTLPDYSQEGTLWHRMGRFMAEHGIVCPNEEESGYSIYHDEDYRDTDVDVEIAVPVEQAGADSGAFVYKMLPAIPLAATLRFSGPYEGYTQAISRLASWIEEKGYQMCGGIRGAAIRSPSDESDPQHYLTEIQIPIQK